METDFQNYPFQKVSMDISGWYRETLREDEYIQSFENWLTN